MNEKHNPEGLVLSITRASGEDGPGIRTTVFLKGCPLRCAWCHSPQSQGGIAPRLVFLENRCIRCGLCVKACPGGVQLYSGGVRSLRWEICQACGECVAVCPGGALEMAGRWMTVDEVVRQVSRDALYYESSCGGVTFSGGEPTAQAEFLEAAAGACKNRGFHTALDTCGYVSWKKLERILPFIDLMLFDLKHMDPVAHTLYTGVSNELIISNLEKIDTSGTAIWIRMPLIPGLNDSDEHIREAAALVTNLSSVEKITVLSYNTAAGAKYPSVGWTYGVEPASLSSERLDQIVRELSNTGVEVELRT